MNSAKSDRYGETKVVDEDDAYDQRRISSLRVTLFGSSAVNKSLCLLLSQLNFNVYRCHLKLFFNYFISSSPFALFLAFFSVPLIFRHSLTPTNARRGLDAGFLR